MSHIDDIIRQSVEQHFQMLYLMCVQNLLCAGFLFVVATLIVGIHHHIKRTWFPESVQISLVLIIIMSLFPGFMAAKGHHDYGTPGYRAEKMTQSLSIVHACIERGCKIHIDNAENEGILGMQAKFLTDGSDGENARRQILSGDIPVSIINMQKEDDGYHVIVQANYGNRFTTKPAVYSLSMAQFPFSVDTGSMGK